jgi:hypothetical protein
MEKQLRRQINAINKAILEGRVKNVYSATNKVKNLKIRLEMYQRKVQWQTYLSK